MMPLNLSSPGQSGTYRFAALPCAVSQADYRTRNKGSMDIMGDGWMFEKLTKPAATTKYLLLAFLPSAVSMCHLPSSVLNCAPTTTVSKAQSFLMSRTRSTWSKYARSSR